MSIDVHSVPVCFDKVRIILNSMRGSTGIPWPTSFAST
jgi:hypothetical protein